MWAILFFIMVQMDAFSPKTHWYSSWNSTMCCNFLCFAVVHVVVSSCLSSSVGMLLRSVPEVQSSEGDDEEMEAITIIIGNNTL